MNKNGIGRIEKVHSTGVRVTNKKESTDLDHTVTEEEKKVVMLSSKNGLDPYTSRPHGSAVPSDGPTKVHQSKQERQLIRPVDQTAGRQTSDLGQH